MPDLSSWGCLTICARSPHWGYVISGTCASGPPPAPISTRRVRPSTGPPGHAPEAVDDVEFLGDLPDRGRQGVARARQRPSVSAVGVACCQLPLRVGELEDNRARLTAAIVEAAEGGALVVVLPELATSGYVFADAEEARRLAEPSDGPTVAGWESLARAHGLVIVGGLCELEPDGTLRNSAVIIDETGLRAVYRKAHLWDREKLVFLAGDAPPPVVETSIGRIATMVCYDLEFPEWVRLAALAGAELLCVPTNWPTFPRPEGERPGEVVRALAAAATNRMFVAACDRVGAERGVDSGRRLGDSRLRRLPTRGPGAGGGDRHAERCGAARRGARQAPERQERRPRRPPARALRQRLVVARLALGGARAIRRDVEGEAERDQDPLTAVDPAWAPDEDVHERRPREQEEAEEWPDPRVESKVDPVAEDPDGEEGDSWPETEREKSDATHGARFSLVTGAESTLRGGRARRTAVRAEVRLKSDLTAHRLGWACTATKEPVAVHAHMGREGFEPSTLGLRVPCSTN